MSSSQISSSSTDAPAGPFAGLLDVLCTVDVIVGTGSITVRDCLALKRNSIIRLEQNAGTDLQLKVHGVAAAAGEIVVYDEAASLRITRILPPDGAEQQS